MTIKKEDSDIIRKEIDLDVLLKTNDNDLLTVFGGCGFSREELRQMKRTNKKVEKPTVEVQLKSDRELLKLKAHKATTDSKYQQALKVIDDTNKKLESVLALKDTISIHTIKTPKSSGKTEATAVWVASDWHTDEFVDGQTINNLNHFDPEVAQKRVDNFFTASLRLTEMSGQDVKIETIVLALLGDFFTGHIHPDFMELTDTEPIHAVIRVQNMIASGIQYILDNSDYKLVIPCHSGNHARTTDKTRFATENGHSLEFYMYHFLADHFKGEKRVQFIIPTGYHSYMDIYGVKIRFHHGHALKYGGGIGGLYIPVNKAIAQWNKAFKADLDVFGHFHQLRDGGNFICNGSLIGYSSFALSIKADYEKPRQALFLINSKYGVNCIWKVDVE